MNKTLEHGTIRVRNSLVTIIGGCIWELAISASILKRLVVNYSCANTVKTESFSDFNVSKTLVK